MFERFAQNARRAVVLAQEEARLLNHNYIGTEHILLGLAREGEGVAAQALKTLDVSLERVRAEVERIIGRGQVAPGGHIPFTPRAKKVLELSLREALQLGHNYIGTAHILLGVVREGEGVAAQVLEELTPGLAEVRQQVLQILAAGGGRAEDEPQAGGVATPPLATMAGGPGAFQQQEPPELIRVIPLAREVHRGDGYRLVLISLELWSEWMDLRYALLSETAPLLPEVDLDWRVADSNGMEYEMAGATSSGGRLLNIRQLTFQPGLADDAHSITLTAVQAREGAAPVAVEIELAPGA